MRGKMMPVMALAIFALVAVLVSAQEVATKAPARVAVDRSLVLHYEAGNRSVGAVELERIVRESRAIGYARIVRIHDLPAKSASAKGGVRVTRLAETWPGGRVDVYARGLTLNQTFVALNGELVKLRENPKYANSYYRGGHRRVA